MNLHQNKLDAGLYCVPTPIGNLGDITLRGLDVLRSCDMIVCEDSRMTGRLLKAYDIPSKKKIIYNDHASIETRDYIVSLVAEGRILALVSDAGTPLISDPGYKLVRACFDAGVYVTALPGSNAVLPAIQLSGLPSDVFTFAGFLPRKVSAVGKMISEYSAAPETLIFYDTASRILKNLKAMRDVLGDRQIAVVREISKLYEESIRGTISDVIDRISGNAIKGEIVIVVEGAQKSDEDFDVPALIRSALSTGESVKELAARLASDTGQKKKDIYNLAIKLRDE
ncbi:MAG: 16S rRNA (cytidine(1402)-2'-O)-methyltransferase [Alphaproteobacteria bacterium]|nr:MAG: 16S rRNA (cytidine(1402)-2'-O)-methyltransferase [Alphaproteobacteria bacterium]